VVRATGGLDDTVRDPEEDAENPNGFKFRRPWGTDLVAAIGRSVATYRDRSRWERMVRTGMAEDFSWRRSARRYGPGRGCSLACRRDEARAAARLYPDHAVRPRRKKRFSGCRRRRVLLK
jgi:hypothetical protein